MGIDVGRGLAYICGTGRTTHPDMEGRKTMTSEDMMTAAHGNLMDYRAAKVFEKVAIKNGDKPGATFWRESAEFWLERVDTWLTMAAMD